MNGNFFALCRLCLAGSMMVILTGWARADDDEFESSPASVIASQTNFDVDDLTAQQTEEIEQLIDQLGASRFLTRERAYARLSAIGHQTIPFLLERYEASSDTEVRSRAKSLADHLAVSYWQGRIDRFLGGENLGFQGWDTFKHIMGDHLSARQTFVGMMRDYPAVLASLDAPTAQLETVAFNVAGKVVQKQRMRRFMTTSDVIAIFLPLSDEELVVSKWQEDAIINLLYSDAIRGIRQNSQLAKPFSKLLGQWIARCSPSKRSVALYFALDWQVESALPVAIKTLEEADDFRTITDALRLIACVGSQSDAINVLPLLDNQTGSKEAAFSGRRVLQTKVCDVALATIAILHDRSLSEFGLSDSARHPRAGFNINQIGFSEQHKNDRTRYILKAKQLFDSDSSTEGS